MIPTGRLLVAPVWLENTQTGGIQCPQSLRERYHALVIAGVILKPILKGTEIGSESRKIYVGASVTFPTPSGATFTGASFDR